MQTTASSNITFGYADDSNYVGNPSLTLTSSSNFSYSLNSFGLGPVYYINETATSYYY